MSWRGFGQIDIGPLAQAFFQGQLSPAYLPPQSFQPSYLPEGQLSTLPTDDYATDAFAAQLAGLLGGQVVQAPPPGNIQGTGMPPANWVSVDGQMILPGNLFPPGVILSFPDECAAENELAAEIPGAQLSSACASGQTGMTPTQLAVSQGATIPVTPSGQSTIVGYTPPAVSAPIITAPALPATPVTIAPTSGGGNTGQTHTSAPPAASQVVSGTAGSNVSSSTGAPASSSSDIVVGGVDLSSIPWYVWAAGGVALFLAFMPKGGR
jgi:hypothetical protein